MCASRAVQSFYVDSRVHVCPGIEMDVSEWFPVNVGLSNMLCNVSRFV